MRKPWQGDCLGREARASVHNESPQLLAASHRGDVQAIVVAFLDMLIDTCVCHIVVVPLLHGSVSIVDRDPLSGRQTQTYLLLRCLCTDKSRASACLLALADWVPLESDTYNVNHNLSRWEVVRERERTGTEDSARLCRCLSTCKFANKGHVGGRGLTISRVSSSNDSLFRF